MKYIKINNFYDKFGQPDYKGLDLKQICAGSQLYPADATYCVIATNEEFPTLPQDVEEITEEIYIQEKSNMQTSSPQNQSEVSAQTVADLQKQLETLSQAVAQMQLG